MTTKTQTDETYRYLTQLSEGEEFEIPDRATPFIVEAVETETDLATYEWRCTVDLAGKRGGEYWMDVTLTKKSRTFHAEIRRRGSSGIYQRYTDPEAIISK